MRNHLSLTVLLAVFCLSVLTGNASITTTYHPVYFATDSFSLTAEATAQLTALVKQLPTTGEIEIFIAGHTDAEGNSQYNKQLSQARATAVTAQLAQMGIAEENIHYEYFGESKPVSANSNEAGKAKNRRVEIAVKHTVINSMSDIIGADTALAPQQFAVNTATGATIKGRNGIQIAIPANAFADANGNVVNEKEVTVTLTEFTDVAAAFMHGVTSMSDKGLLESGGMYNLTAMANGQPLQLVPGKALSVQIPSVKAVDDMSVYVSKTGSKGELVWVKTDAAFKPASQPKDMRTIKLERNKYQDFLGTVVSMPSADEVPEVVSFNQVKPGLPVRPVLRLQKLRTMRTSGLQYIFKTKREKQKMLERLNKNIETANARRQVKYEQQVTAYLADSASYPKRLKEYNAAKVNYVDYSMKKRAELNALYDLYRDAVVKKRMVYFVGRLVVESEKDMLYNGNLVQRSRVFCSSEEALMRNPAFEQKMTTAYDGLEGLNGKKTKHYYGYITFQGYYAFNRIVAQPDVKSVLAALVNDNPYLMPKEKDLQLAVLNSTNAYPAYATSTTYSADAVNTYYQATIGQLGYVNCDRLREASTVVAMNVQNVAQQAQSVAFVKGINASQSIYEGPNKFKANEELRFLSVYFVDGRPQVAYQEVKAAGNGNIALQYKEMKTQEFKELVLSFI